jgi:outer membrane receptor protein involved in Fe transport
MKTTFKILVTFLSLFCISLSYGQSISGTILDDTGMPLPGVNVILESTNKGAITDFDGKYIISNVDDGEYTITVNFLGFKKISKQIVVAGSDLSEDFVMSQSAQSLDQVVITGVANPRAKIESSVSVTSLKPENVKQSAPRTTAEILRTVPGIRSESSGGEGNSNIAVRGVPVSSGGSKYVQFQEDGLPVLLFGDISFGTADIFTRFDSNIQRVEVIRGGSASTLSSNSPGAIINFISKTGRREGGSVSTDFGLDYNSFRTDFEYGAPIGDNLYFHMGGFYRAGESVRNIDYTANNGGQFKFNLTKDFDEGYVRVYAKYLNDRAAAYLPMPIQVTGTNSNPNWSNAPGFDATQGALQSIFLPENLGIDKDGNRRRTPVSDGMNPISTSVGFEASFDLGQQWKVKNSGRASFNKGGFISPFPAQIASAGDLLAGEFANSNGWDRFQFADSGEPIANSSLVNNSIMFDVELNNFNNFMNDFKITKSIDKIDLTFGFFKSIQNVSMTWMWNSYLQEVSDDNARMIDVLDTSGNPLSENGLYAYGSQLFGNLHRNYDTQYNVSAPYFNAAFEASDKLNIDASVRLDLGNVDGSFAGGTSSAIDMNNDGVISAPEQNAFSVDNANATPVNYNYDYVSYSLGANYKLQNKEAVFGRYSRGAAAKADRILFTGLNYLNSDQINALDFLNQAEIGYKRGFDNAELNVTAFYAKTVEEGGFEVTSNSIIENDYKSFGLELDGYYTLGDFSIRGSVTYTDAEIDSGVNAGNKPRRQPDFIYNFVPSFNFGNNKRNSLGLSVIGQTESFSQDTNGLVMPGFALINGFVNVSLTDQLSANISANNIFDSLGITEAEEASIVENQVNYVRARALPGRTISLGVNYKF